MTRTTEWVVSLETAEPGWLLVPSDLSSHERDTWIAEISDELRTAWADGWQDGYEATVRHWLEIALEDRDTSAAHMVFQVWPVFAPVAALGRVIVVPSREAPAWTKIDGVVHRVHAASVGPGLQWARRRTVIDDEGEKYELCSLSYVFDDGESTLIVALEETAVELVSRILTGFVGLLDSIRMETENGDSFASVEPRGILEDSPWTLEEAT